MNKWEKELARLELQGEREVLEQMRRHYAVALSRVNAKIEELAYRDDLPGIRQRRYQEMLAEEIGGIMDDLGSGCYGTLGEYLEQCYEQGFVGTLYNLQKQGVPLAFPIDQRSMARAVTMTAGDVKLSKRVYDNVGKLQEQVIAEITRGFADGSHATKVAQRIAEETDIADSIKRNVQGRGSQAFRRSMTIARTEKGRVKATSTLEAMYKAKEAGADIVKQWDSTMDSRTRKDHVKADGQIRELDEDFEVGGCLGPSPHLMGAAAQDINCRCVCLQRSRSALEWDEPSQKWDGVNQCYADLSDAKSYAEFKGCYDNLVDDAEKAKQVVDAFFDRESTTRSIRQSGLSRKAVEGEMDSLLEECGGIASLREIGASGRQNLLSTVVASLSNLAQVSDRRAKIDSSAARMYPGSIAGVKRGQPMSFKEADGGRVNPYVDKTYGTDVNCQSCVVAFEMRLRGYRVRALPRSKWGIADELAKETNLAWVDGSTGLPPKYLKDVSANTPSLFKVFLEKNVVQGGRYTLEFGYAKHPQGHIVSLDRDESGRLRIYDPQDGSIIQGRDMDLYLQELYYGADDPPKILRVDDKLVNEYVASEIMEGVR